MPSRSYDLATTCPLARWKKVNGSQTIYTIEGLAPCAVIADGAPKPFSWSYDVTCVVHSQRFSSRHDTKSHVLKEAVFWLRRVGCPGQAEPDPG